MTDSFAALKRSRETSMERLTKEIDKFSNKGKYEEDENFWKPEVDKSGNGYAVIRFLPAPPGEDVPWVRLWTHGFQGPGGWYIENSLTTLNKPDPVSDLNSKLWAQGDDKSKEIARARKRKLSYISNIYVVKDPANPDNEGKVFLYKYGKKIFDKMNAKMHPEFQDDKPMNPFDLWQGANFRLKIRKFEGQRNYDLSEFDGPSALLDGDDEALEKLWKSEHKLQPLVSEDKFKTYEQLKARLDRVLKTEEGDQPFDANEFESLAAPKIKSSESKKIPAKNSAEDTDDEDSLAMFQRLAEED